MIDNAISKLCEQKNLFLRSIYLGIIVFDEYSIAI